MKNKIIRLLGGFTEQDLQDKINEIGPETMVQVVASPVSEEYIPVGELARRYNVIRNRQFFKKQPKCFCEW